jgi:hypothetical protein
LRVSKCLLPGIEARSMRYFRKDNSQFLGQILSAVDIMRASSALWEEQKPFLIPF